MSTKMSINVTDYFVFPFYLIAILVASTPLLNSKITGFDLSATWQIAEGHYLSVASLVAIIALGYVATTNDWEGDIPWQSTQGFIVVATISLILSPPFVPAFQDTLLSTPAGFIAAGIQILGFMAFSYYG